MEVAEEWTVEQSEQERGEKYTPSTSSSPCHGPTQHPVHRKPEGCFPRGKAAGDKHKYLPPSSTGSPILVTLIMEAIRFTETSVLKRSHTT
jgi:hypothetical protein